MKGGKRCLEGLGMRESVTGVRCQHYSMEEGIDGAMARFFDLSGSVTAFTPRRRGG